MNMGMQMIPMGVIVPDRMIMVMIMMVMAVAMTVAVMAVAMVMMVFMTVMMMVWFAHLFTPHPGRQEW
ncbi:hypothetical protein [uncultured Cohaesibacter sp.]|uniref:hypothetical protein n=1 Tax=uncultured Cohaesibacter sp. TaxID=1002546 RepID=UPI0029C91DAA|nr:hypothetical protein [uncultured Cohaesibacter sp.]